MNIILVTQGISTQLLIYRDPLYVEDEIKTEIEHNFEQGLITTTTDEYHNESDLIIDTVEPPETKTTIVEDASSRLQNNGLEILPIVFDNDPLFNSKRSLPQESARNPMSSSVRPGRGKGRPKKVWVKWKL